MANVLNLIPDRKQAVAVLLVILACVFALLPAFHHHQLIHLSAGESVLAPTAASAELAPGGRPAELAAAHPIEVDCKLCALGNQTPLRGADSPRVPLPTFLAEGPSAPERCREYDAVGAAQPRAPPPLV